MELDAFINDNFPNFVFRHPLCLGTLVRVTFFFLGAGHRFRHAKLWWEGIRRRKVRYGSSRAATSAIGAVWFGYAGLSSDAALRQGR